MSDGAISETNPNGTAAAGGNRLRALWRRAAVRINAPWLVLPWLAALAGLCALIPWIGFQRLEPFLVVINTILVLTMLFRPAPRNRRRPIDNQLEQLQDLHWEINENEARYRDLLDEQADMILRRDASGRLKFVNLAFARTFDLDPSQALETTFRPTVIETASSAAPGAHDGLHRKRRIELVVTRSGQRWIEWDDHTVRRSGSGDPEIQTIGRDVTTERRVAQELSEARDQAEAGSRAKSRFLAAMSHEIRTPMNGILGMASLIIETDQTPEQTTYTKAIDQSARNLVALIDEILDFSKIEAGKLVLSQAPFSLEATIQAVVELFAASAQQKGLEIAWSVDDSACGLLLGDQARVRQIILNLVSNAVKFTDRGGILVKAQRNADVTSITVEDTGIGVSEEDRRGLFVEFEQADPAIRRRLGGTGLGLAISQRLARAMGGGISISSTPGKGSVFVVDLLLPCLPPASHNPARQTSMSILLAFNKSIERVALYDWLKTRGFNVEQCAFEDALPALEAAAARGAPIDRILVELDADPVAAGALLTRARSLGENSCRPSAEVRGLVLVNVLSRRTLDAFRNQGFSAYLVRPVRPSALLEQIGAIVPRRGHNGVFDASDLPASSTGRAHLGRETPPRILVAEDNAINALLATRVLERCGCEVVLVTDGRQAVDAFTATLRDPASRFDLIFMDVFMPELDGVEATREINNLYHASPQTTPKPPIVALTANAFPEDRDRYLAEGMDDYLAKPFDKSALEALLVRWVERADPSERQLPAA